MAKRYYWLQMRKDFFNDKRVKKLRKIAGGDTYTIIYLKMMLYSLEKEGVLEFEGVEKSLAEEIALVLDEDADNVQIAVNFLIQCGLLVDMGNNQYFLREVAENLGSEGASAKRVRDYRERQKALQCNADVTEVKQIGNVEKRIEEKRIEDKRTEDKRINYLKIIDMYNATCVSFPKVTSLSQARKKAISARLKTFSLEQMQLMFEKAEASDFLKGKNDRNWSATFDWMLKDSNMAKILDGNYDNRGSQIQKTNRVADELEQSYEMMRNWAEGK